MFDRIFRFIRSNAFRRLHDVFLGCVMTYGAFLVFFSTTPYVWAQQPSRDELERRVMTIEGQNLEHRVTVMETVLTDLQSNILWQRLNMGGTGLLLAEVVTRRIRGKQESKLVQE